MTHIIFISMAVLGGTALVSAVILFLTAKKFNIPEDSRLEEIEALLPQANCGGCGRAGCHDFAQSCLQASAQEFAALNCPVGGLPVMKKIAAFLGYTAVKKEATRAVLRCNGSCQNAPAKITYDGVSSCRIAHLISSGQSGCPNGCLHLGDCIKVCPFGALKLDEKTFLPVVDANKCTSCGACVGICPRGLFEIRAAGPYVACRNTQKGAIARKNCKAACIACGKCTKISSDILLENNLSYIPSSAATRSLGEELRKSCPTGAICLTTEKKDE